MPLKQIYGMDIKGSFSEDEEEPPDWVPPPPPIENVKNEQPTTNGSLEYDADTSEDDSVAWPSPPPPPPPFKSASPTSDSEWEGPLPPEILALQGRRDRMAMWVDDESEDSDSDIFANI